MKREIKFRALKDDMSNCTFVYGQLVYDAIDIPRITEKCGDGLKFNTCIKGTEGQFTGLKDSKGVEIYEGDILKRKCKLPEYEGQIFNNAVYYLHGRFRIKNGRYTSDLTKNNIYNGEMEVIGNIHENPELLQSNL